MSGGGNLLPFATTCFPLPINYDKYAHNMKCTSMEKFCHLEVILIKYKLIHSLWFFQTFLHAKPPSYVGSNIRSGWRIPTKEYLLTAESNMKKFLHYSSNTFIVN